VPYARQTLDVVVLSFRPPYRPPDDESPALRLETLGEAALLLAVPTTSPLAGRDTVQLSEQSWIASPGSSSDPLLGVWPGLAGRPRISHTARDWRTVLYLVAAGAGITTVPTSLSAAVPAGVRLLAVQGGPVERRRMVLARLPGPASPMVVELARALRQETARL